MNTSLDKRSINQDFVGKTIYKKITQLVARTHTRTHQTNIVACPGKITAVETKRDGGEGSGSDPTGGFGFVLVKAQNDEVVQITENKQTARSSKRRNTCKKLSLSLSLSLSG